MGEVISFPKRPKGVPAVPRVEPWRVGLSIARLPAAPPSIFALNDVVRRVCPQVLSPALLRSILGRSCA